jgi:hypothetical protein
MYVSVSFTFIACFLSLSPLFLVVLAHVSSLSVHVYSLFFVPLAAFPLFCPFFPCLFLRCHSRMTCILRFFPIFFLARHCPHLPPNNIWLFDVRLIFYHSFSPIPCYVTKSVMICLLYKLIHPFVYFILIFIFFLFHLTHTDHHVYRLGTMPTSSAALSLATRSRSTSASATGCVCAFIDASRSRPFVHSRPCVPHWMWARTWICPLALAWGVPLWRLNLPRVVVLMEKAIWPLSLDRHLVLRPRSRGWICCARGGRRVRVVLQGQWRR